MHISQELIEELQNRLKVGNRRGVHLNGIPGRSRFKFDLCRLRYIQENLPENFITELLNTNHLKFNISWKDNIPDFNQLFIEEQTQIINITKSFESLINETQSIFSEKGINTFGFGFPLLVRKDKSDNQLTVAPIFIWSLDINKTKDFNTWQVTRNEDDSIYINEVLANHLVSDIGIEIRDLIDNPNDKGILNYDEFINACEKVLNKINGTNNDYLDTFSEKIQNLKEIPLKKEFEELPLTYNNSYIHFGGLFSIFEVQKQSVIKDYEYLKEITARNLDLEDLRNHQFQSISSIETDPSQQALLNSLSNKRHLLIQGPPGTGKSQSLTAVLVNALENGKKCIVVCEKRTALEVLHESLKKKGLESLTILLKDLVKDRKGVVDSVRNRIETKNEKSILDRSLNEASIGLRHAHKKINDLINQINFRHLKLDEEIIEGKNWTHIVGQYLKNYKSSKKTLEYNTKNFEYSANELNRYLNKIEKGSLLYLEFNQIKKLSFLNALKLKGENAFEIEDNLKNDFKEYSKIKESLFELLVEIKGQYQTDYLSEFSDLINLFQNSWANISQLVRETKTLEDDLKKNYQSRRHNHYQSELSALNTSCSEIQQLITKNLTNSNFNFDKVNSFIFKLFLPLSKKNKETKRDFEHFITLTKIVTEKVESLDNLNLSYIPLINPQETQKYTYELVKQLKTLEINQIIEEEFKQLNIPLYISSSLDDYKNYISSWEYDSDFRSMLLNNLESINLRFEQEFDFCEKAKEKHHEEIDFEFSGSLNKRISSLQNYIDELTLKEKERKKNIEEIIDKLNIYDIKKQFKNERLNNYIDTIEKLKLRIEEDGWIQDVPIFLENSNEDIQQLTKLIKTTYEYFNHADNPFLKEFKWFSFYNSLSRWEKELIGELINTNNWQAEFLRLYFDSILKGRADLDSLFIDNSDHLKYKYSIKSLEQLQTSYILKKWQSIQNKEETNFNKNNSISISNLYNKRKSHKHRRLSLRNIVSMDYDLFTSFFPVILTTPEVCSSLFPKSEEYFDIVLFDEASQLRLEDNLPALLKGKQVIIAGDEHQMPPSNYFSKNFDGDYLEEEEEEEEEIRKDDFILSCESMLEFGQELGFEKKYLDFHYRSKHPYLIDFSNNAFYNGRLKPLPATEEYIPIKYINVSGIYLNQSNEMEAEMVLSIITNNINRLPNGEYPTVGIATFNIHQRNLIINKIRERQQLSIFEEFNSKMIELEASGFFVKNLENIQGDERDVIILSTTYGKDQDGKFAQRFGPINFNKGYKLLNVIITRAKYKVYVCTSIPEDFILRYNDYLLAEKANNRRAVFFSYLAYAKSVSEGNNQFRDEILKNLINNSSYQREFNPEIFKLESPFEEEVYQYLLDKYGPDNITAQLNYAGFRIDIVYNPKRKDKKKIAIECDGSTYHSSQEAYLHDHHRQKILEQHGFVFHRIWSTNWWRNPSREVKKLYDFIDRHEENSEAVEQTFTSLSNAFTDDFIEVNIEDSPFSINKKQRQFEESNENNINIDIDGKKVELNQIIELKYLNSDDNFKIKIIDGKFQKSGEINMINIKTPLAAAIMGKLAGSVVKVGALDKYVEILNVG